MVKTHSLYLFVSVMDIYMSATRDITTMQTFQIVDNDRKVNIIITACVSHIYLFNKLYFKMSCVYCCQLPSVYCCSCLVCTVVILYVFVVLCVYCCFYFRCPTAGQKSVSGRSYDRPPRHRFFLVSLCLKANAEMVPKIPSCHYMLLMQPSRLQFISNQFHVLFTCKITTATG